jgi:L-amino acid ligase C-terminal domain 2
MVTFGMLVYLKKLLRFFLRVSETYDSLPDRPETLNSNGLIMHLVSNKKGTVTKINHVQEIKGMESVKLIEIEAKVGDQVVETINIRTDSGYVLLENVDSEALQRDYNRILDLQETMFEVEDDGKTSSEGQKEAAAAPPVSKSRRRRRAHFTDQDTVPREILEQQSFEELPRQQEGMPRQQGGLMQSFGTGSVQQRGQLQGSSSPVTALLARLKQKLSKIAVRASAILAGYCVALYAAAIVLPLIC